MTVSTNHVLFLCVCLARICEKWFPIPVSLSDTHACTHLHVHMLLYRSARAPGAWRLWHAFGRDLWITAVTSLKCLSEGFLRGSGLGQCLHWHLHTSHYRPVWLGTEPWLRAGRGHLEETIGTRPSGEKWLGILSVVEVETTRGQLNIKQCMWTSKLLTHLLRNQISSFLVLLTEGCSHLRWNMLGRLCVRRRIPHWGRCGFAKTLLHLGMARFPLVQASNFPF